MTRSLADVLRKVPNEVWQAPHFPQTHTVYLAQTCTTIRDTIREARMPAALCVTHHRLSFACERYEVESVKLVTEARFLDCAPYKCAHEKQLIEMLPQMPKLKRLDMHNMSMGLYYNNSKFFLALGNCPGLRALTLSCNALGTLYVDIDAKMLAHRMTQLPQLQYLDLRRNNLRTASMLIILGACKQCPSLTELRLGFNSISFDGHSTCDIGSVLTTLDLSGCQMSDDTPTECDDLQRFLMASTSLTALNLSGNELAHTHVTALVNSLQYMTALTSLDVSDNYLSLTATRRIRSAWKTDRKKLIV